MQQLNIFTEKGKHPSQIYEFLNFNDLDAFYCEDVLNVIYGKNWNSVLITSEKKYFFHVFSKKPITGTQYFDIEPFLGYFGPITNSTDNEFVSLAWRQYGEICREEGVIAELIRFNPLSQNHKQFSGASVDIVYAKEIVIVDCEKNEQDQLLKYKEVTRKQIRKASNYCQTRILGKRCIQDFRELYYSALKRFAAKREWYFTDSFFDRVKQSPVFELYQTSDGRQSRSMSIVIRHKGGGYYFLATNSFPTTSGINDVLIYQICLNLAQIGARYLILGGGNTALANDSLLFFKKRFSSKSYPFYIGKIVHNPEVFQDFCSLAEERNPFIKNSNFFLKYRLVKNSL